MSRRLARLALAAALVIAKLDYHYSLAFITRPSAHITINNSAHSSISTCRLGWLDNFLPQKIDNDESDQERRRQYPEQYPASYELSSIQVAGDTKEVASIIRPLLLQTQLEQRPLSLAYDASQHGWSPESFHTRVDGKGGCHCGCHDKNKQTTK